VRLLRVGLIVPHAPALLPQVRGGPAPDTDIPPDEGGPLCILLSPHGDETGVYRRVRGDLDAFGIGGVQAERRTDRAFGKSLAAAWNKPLLSEDPDHGVVVPLIQGIPLQLRVVAACLKEWTGPEEGDVESVIAEARAFAGAVIELSVDHDIIVAASAHSAASLSPGAPLMERAEGHELEQEITKALETDLGMLASIDVGLWKAAGACGVGPLTAFGVLFEGHTARASFREAPFGVGYLLAQTE